MPVTQDRLTRLREFGLSEYGARAYLALLDLGIAEARDVSSISKVPQAKIYHVLEQLHEKGLVVILPEFPKKYAPVPFEEYLQRLYDEHTKQAQAIEAERDTLAEMFRVMGETNVGDRGFFTVIRGRRNVLAKIEEMVAHARSDLLVLGTAGGAARALHFVPEIKAARGRGVNVRFLHPIDSENLQHVAKLGEIADVRAREATGDERADKVAIVVADSTTAFLIHFVPDDANLYAGKDIGVFTDQEAMVAAIQAIVDPHWVRATRLDRRREEIVSGRAPDATRLHTSPDSVTEALREALAGATREVRVVDSTGEAVENASALLRDLPAGKPARFILNVAEPAACAAAEKLGTPPHEVRHLKPRLTTRHVLVDGRQAFVWLAAGGEAEGLVVQTDSTPVLQSLTAHFDGLWRSAASLSDRAAELEALPDGAPLDVATGRLLVLLGESFFVLDRDWRIVYTNPVADQMRKAAPQQEIMGKNLWDLFPELRGTRFDSEYHRAMRDGVPVRVEEQWPRTGRWYEANAIPTAEGLYVFFRDVTERKTAAAATSAAQTRFRALLGSTPVATALASAEGVVLASNDAFTALLGSADDLSRLLPEAWAFLAGVEEGDFSVETELPVRGGRAKVRVHGCALRLDGARELLVQVSALTKAVSGGAPAPHPRG